MATVDVDRGVAPDPRHALTAGRLVLLASLAALGALATNIMLPAFPAMARDLGVAPGDLAWTLSSFFVVFAVGQLFVGPLADAWGRAPFVVGGLAVFVAGSIVCALAPSLPVLIAGRAVQALGACAASVLARAIARDLYHGPELTRALALVMIAMAAAPGFSPALGTGMTIAFGWRSTFVLVAVAGVLVALHYRLSAGETLPPGQRRPARPHAIARTFVELAIDPRFILPALAVSLVIGCLYSFFGAAPAILMADMGLSATGLSIFFGATVFVVFGSGLMTARLVRRWSAIAQARCDSLLVFPDSAMFEVNDRVSRFALEARLPSVSGWSPFARNGLLLTYGPDVRELYRSLGGYVDRILHGAPAASLPVQLPSKVELVVNLKTARALGLTIPPTLLARADEVIE